MPLPTIPAAQTQAVNALSGGTIPFTSTWWNFFNNLLTYIAGGGIISIIPVTQWYVSSTGSDSNNGQSPATAFLTINKAIATIYSYDWNSQSPTINVGAGTFAAFSAYGMGRGSGYNSQAASNPAFIIQGAGSGLTTITHGIFLRGALMIINGVTITCNSGSGDSDPGISIDGNGYVVTTGDIIFSGNGALAQCWSVNDFSAVFHYLGSITLTGTVGTYYAGFNTANYETVGATGITCQAALGSLCVLDILSNMHSFGGGVTFSGGGTATGPAYEVSGNSVISGYGTLDTIWHAAGGETGALLTGGRSESSVTAPSVTGSSGLGSGSAALASGANAMSLPITLSPAGSPGSSGTVTVQINEYPSTAVGTLSAYVCCLINGSSTWAVGATVQIISTSLGAGGGTIELGWSNNGSNLTAGQTYGISLIAQT